MTTTYNYNVVLRIRIPVDEYAVNREGHELHGQVDGVHGPDAAVVLPQVLDEELHL